MAVTASRRNNMPQRGPRSARDLTMRDAPTADRRPAGGSSNNRSRDRTACSLAQLKITGWRNPNFKHADDEDRGASKLTKFIERRANIAQDKHAKSRGIRKDTLVRARKSRVEGDALILSVPTEDVRSILSAQGYEFGGINIRIEVLGGSGPVAFGGRDTSELTETPKIKESILAAIRRRFNKETRILDLSNIGQDPDLNNAGFHGLLESYGTKFFRCIMTVCDSFFKTREEKEELIIGITLANNGLKDITPVMLLADLKFFPDLKAIDLSGNQISKVGDLSKWDYKLKKLQHIVLSGNPIETDSTVARSLVQQFPALLTINNSPIPPEIYIKPTPPKVRPPVFDQDGGVATRFLTTFYQGFDNQRADLVPHFYDANSKFSYCVNMKSLRAPSEPKVLPKGEWSTYTRNSRNLHILNNPHTKIQRLHQGVEDIKKAFSEFPATHHLGYPEKWLVECSMIPNVPDLNGTKGGVNGLRILLHGEFREVETGKNRSFDRTFILAPGPNEVRVVNDMMTIRGYGGCEAFQAELPEPEVQPPIVQEAAAISEEEQKKLWVIELSQITGMNLKFAELCMEQCGWIPADALASFNDKNGKGELPAEVFAK
ncbi:hypothetical protein FKW77_006148 [Venturia effusa]|uniref:Nuclear mRNA export, poly(A)+RNA binding protein n=1 Tax=Venturia effusa TaxID=50376 RepID=A0A517KWJ6_9PEZI|nr:hypothetical protein FKW77_006148 [Venturia effusa]